MRRDGSSLLREVSGQMNRVISLVQDEASLISLLYHTGFESPSYCNAMSWINLTRV